MTYVYAAILEIDINEGRVGRSNHQFLGQNYAFSLRVVFCYLPIFVAEQDVVALCIVVWNKS